MNISTKQKLIDAALKLFNEKGFENTSTTSICKEAGFSSGALFVHFKTKNELLDYIYIEVKRKMFDFVFSGVNDSMDTKNKIHTIIERSFLFYLNNYEEYVFMESFGGSIHVSRIAKEEIEFEMQAFGKVLSEAKAEGLIMDYEDGAIMAGMVGLFYSLVKYVHETGDKDIDKYISMVTKYLFK